MISKIPERSKAKWHTRPLFAAVCVFFASLALILILVWFIGLYESSPQFIDMTDNTADARAVDFDEHGATVQCRFAPDVFLTPEEAGGFPFEAFSPGVGKGTFHILILAPPGREYHLSVEIPGNTASVYINDELAGQPAPMGRQEDTSVYRYSYIVKPENGSIELLIPVTGFDNTGVDRCNVDINDNAFLTRIVNLRRLRDSLVTGALLIAFLLLLCIWFFHIKMPQNLYFALCCLFIAVRKSVIGARIMQLVFPDGEFLRLEYICFCLLLPLLTLYLNRVFSGPFHKSVLRAICALPLLYAFLILLTDYPAYSAWLPLYQVFLATSAIYMTARIIQRLRKPTLDQIVSLTGILVFLFASLIDMISISDLVPFYLPFTLTLAEPGMIVLVLTQLVALFTGNARITAEARVAEQRLARENDALEQINRLKTEFLGNVSHELKTPLTVVSGYAQTSQTHLSGQPENEAVINKMKLIASEAERLALMVGQILDVTRIEEGRMSVDRHPCRIDEIIQTAVDTHFPILNKNNNRLKLRIQSGLPMINADPARITQVIVNLVANAIRFTNEGEIIISAQLRGGFVEVVVSDTGRGIDSERFSTIFDRFINSPGGSDTGTGLGLYICRHIVETHGGEITVESELGKGSAFRFTVPVSGQ